MPENLDVLLFWYRVVLVICSITTTAVPILYALTPWRTRLFGKLFMAQAIYFAVAIDVSTIFAFWKPKSILIVFWVNISFMGAIAISTSAIALTIFVIPFRVRRKVKADGVQQEGV